MTPDVSVVIPVRDGARYLAETLDSILDQSYQPAEVIAVDDGSRDSTPELLAQYGGRLRVIRQGRHGIGSALNRGIAASSSEFVAFCDADDLWTPERLVRQVDHLSRDPACSGVGGLVQQFVSPDVPHLAAAVRVHDRPRHVDLLGALLVRRTAVGRIGPFDESARVGVNLDWVARARHLGLRFGTLNEVVLLRRIHGSNLTMTNAGGVRAGMLWTLRAQRRRHRAAPEQPS